MEGATGRRINSLVSHLVFADSLQKNCSGNVGEIFVGCTSNKITAKTKINEIDFSTQSFFSLDSLLSEESRAVQNKVKVFAEIHLQPSAMNLLYEKAEFPFSVIKEYAKLNLIGGTLKGYGCPGLSAVSNGLIAMEVSKFSADVATTVSILQNIVMFSIFHCGSEEQKERFLRKLAKLELLGAFALTEPEFGSDASSLQCRATKVEGGWILNGEKRWIGAGTFADLIIVWARNVSTNQVNGFIVEPAKSSSDCLICTKMENKIALRCVQNAHIEFLNLFVPDENHLPLARDFKSGPGASLFLTRIIAGWIAVGIAANAYERCLRYTMERKQFGIPLAQNQLIQERLMRMCWHVQSMWMMSWRVSVLYDEGKATIGHAGMAKAHNTSLGRQVVSLARECVGGNGMITDFHVGRAFTDMEAVHTFEGSYDINTLIAAREITGLNALKFRK